MPMYKTENDFKHALLRVLKGHGLDCYCIETGRTTQGIPDIFIMGKGGDVWIELKNEPERTFNCHHMLRVDWRPGQQAWMLRYFLAHARKKCCLTVVALKDGFVVITMTNTVLFEQDLVPESACIKEESLGGVANDIEMALKTDR